MGSSFRTALWSALAASALIPLSACGKKGPPLAPFSRVPSAVGGITTNRIGDDIYLTFQVPSTNADGRKPADIQEVRVYAVTADHAPTNEAQREMATLIATVPVRPIMPDPPAPVNGSAPPPVPLPPGVDRGTTAVVREHVTQDTEAAVTLPIDKKIAVTAVPPSSNASPFGPLVAPPPTRLPGRHYFAIASSTRDRKSAPSPVVSLPLERGSSAPGAPVITTDATSMTITWTPPADARAASFLIPPTPKPPTVVPGNETPGNVTPKAPAPLAPLAAKTLGFASDATTYHVYDVTPKPDLPAVPDASAAPVLPNPYDIKMPAAITPAPVADAEFVVKGVAFGVERCFEVRAVDKVYGAVIIGPPSPRTCITPQDEFPPAAPRSVAAIAAPGVINLIWEANTEADLAGYIVLRGDAPGDTLQAVTSEPITTNTFRDDTVKPGARYVYAVVAVDRSKNHSPPSSRVEETARQ